MNHDLFLRRPSSAPPRTFEEVQDLVRDDPDLSALVLDEHTTPELLALADAETGAYVLLTPGGPPEELPEEEDDEAWADEAGPLDLLHVQIPYLRPRFFAAEGARVVRALSALLGWPVEDPAAPAVRDPDEAAIVAAWEAGRHSLLAGLAEEQGPLPQADQGPRRVSAALLEGIQRANLSRREAAAAAGPAVTVPRLGLAELDGAAAAICRYDAGEPLWLPDVATHVLLRRKKKGFLGYKDDEVLVRADELRALLAPTERAGVATPGRRAYAVEWAPADRRWQELGGRSARELRLLDWTDVVETDA